MSIEHENLQETVLRLISSQMQEWQLANVNYAALKKVQSQSISLSDKVKIRLQFNPGRIISSSAKVDDESIRNRACFLCESNRPHHQKGINFINKYEILVNPYPIFPKHLTIVDSCHTPQTIAHRMHHMLTIAKELNMFTIFYNGAKCGASAPDHFHFQAGNKGFMPIEEDLKQTELTTIYSKKGITICEPSDYFRKTVVLQGDNIDETCDVFYKFIELLNTENQEPMINILASYQNNKWQVIIFPRKAHRPYQYNLQGDEQILLSPAAVDFGGVIITPRHEDFLKLDAPLIIDIFEQVTINDINWKEIVKKL